MSNDIKFTIITVCRNAENLIYETMMSVIRQTYQNIQYIIVDGDSTDHTLKIIKDIYEHNQENGLKEIEWISEKDDGIYDAMNKGINMAQGDYIQFLNAGDCFTTDEVVVKAERIIRANKADIYYGNINYIYENGQSEVRKYNKSCKYKMYYLTGDCINHQAIFAKRECFEGLFDLRYRICADREWMMRVSKKGKKYFPLNFIVCDYLVAEDSVSVANKELRKKEATICIKNYFPAGYIIYKSFEFLRSNSFSANLLHWIYKKLYISQKGK